MFLPDRVTPQYLPNGKLPCKWHGYDHDCVRRDSFFNPQGPRACIDDDQGITYIFSGRHEYSMLIQAMPSLSRGDVLTAVANSSDLDLLLLPASYKPEAITSYESLVEFCNALVQSVDATDGNEDILLGFDVEWDSLTAADKKRQKPEVMQLATADGNILQLSSFLVCFLVFNQNLQKQWLLSIQS